MDSIDGLPQRGGIPRLRFPYKHDSCKLWTQQVSVSLATAHAYLGICEVKGQCLDVPIRGQWLLASSGDARVLGRYAPL